ncbi:hypothetical protein NFI95_07105 [Acetobacteraceae bacterium KSS8]|uniref:Uncharacterized protein n=1 Tax=Endosaccharibacter trunci TaxID=2812733 RepID=A0ABT1W5S4_9PROT|nr:hypothetical protein [Acetobacteraceae bacterium KSS8]
MSGFPSGPKSKAMALAGSEDALAGILTRMLESEGGQAGLEKLYQQFDKAGLGEKARSWKSPASELMKTSIRLVPCVAAHSVPNG